jgi:transcription elongation factor Elf1
MAVEERRRTTAVTRDKRTYVCTKCGHTGEKQAAVGSEYVTVVCDKCGKKINVGRAPSAPVTKGV